MAAIDNYNISTSHNYFMSDFPFGNSSSFDLSDYILLHEGPVECMFPTSTEQSQGHISPVADIGGATTTLASGSISNNNTNRVAFRTKSEVEVLDDGFKWRKYGKKSVKNSPNPRNYYRCSTEGCSVKKRVERDRDDPSYVITTYDGIHNHTSADVVYYTTQDDISGQFVVSGCYGMPPSS